MPGGGIPPHVHAAELRLTFKDGGAFDFSTVFERVKERLQQAVELARGSAADTGDGGGRGGGGDMNGINLGSVNLEELPAYSERGDSVRLQADPEPAAAAAAAIARPETTSDGTASSSPGSSRPRTTDVFTPPAEPPPGYEESTTLGVCDELERRLRTGEIEEQQEGRR